MNENSPTKIVKKDQSQENSFLNVIVKGFSYLPKITEDADIISENISKLLKIKGSEPIINNDNPFTPTPENEPVPEERLHKKSDTEKPEESTGIIKWLKNIFDVKNILKGFIVGGLVVKLVSSIWDGIKTAWEDWKEKGNIFESITSGLGELTETITSGLISKETIEDVSDKIADSVGPIVDSISKFFENISEWFSEKFDNIREFIGLPVNKKVRTFPLHIEVHEITKTHAQIRQEERKDQIKKTEEIESKKYGGESPLIIPSRGKAVELPTLSPDDSWIMNMVKKHEGVRTKPYKDSRGLWTVGIGHLIGDGKSLPPQWNREFTMQEVDELFAKDFAEHKKAAEKIPGFEKANKAVKGALIDLTFNMGAAWYKKWPNFIKALAEGNYELAAEALEKSSWYKQVKSRATEIVALVRSGNSEKATEINKPVSPTELSNNEESKSIGEDIANKSNEVAINQRKLQKGSTTIISSKKTNNIKISNNEESYQQENTDHSLNLANNLI